MDIHIVNLLKTNNRVIIPEFGAFIVKSGSPRTIVFNEFLKYNDEVLLKEICRAEKISEDEATTQLENYTRELNSQLDLGQLHKIENLGTLSKDSNGRVHFEMLEGAGIDNAPTPQKKEEQKQPENFSTPVTNSIKEEKAKKEVSSTNEIKPKVTEPVKKAEEKKDIVESKKESGEALTKEEIMKEGEPKEKSVPSTINDEKKKPVTVNDKLKSSVSSSKPNERVTPPRAAVQEKKENPLTNYLNNNKNVVWYSLVAVILVGIAIWFFFNKEYLFDSSNKKKTAQTDEIVIQPDTDDTNVSENEETISENSKEIKEEINDNEVVKKEPEVKKETPAAKKTDSKRYYLVAGCFQQEKNADNYVEYLVGQGYNSEKFGKYGGLYAVSFNSYESFSEAQKELNKIKKATESQAWILYY